MPLSNQNSNQNQNYGNASGNPYGYYQVNAPQIGLTVGAPASSTTGAITIQVEDGTQLLSKNVPDELMRFEMDGDTIIVSFFENIDGKRVKAVFAPEDDLRPIESVRINALMTGCSSMLKVRPITYIKLHNLSRHFRFSEV